jgi:hypothetical protein
MQPKHDRNKMFVAARYVAGCPAMTNGVAGQVITAVRISEVYRALTGKAPRRTSTDRHRGPAAWRNGDGFNVSLDDSRGHWHDFVTDEGGGVLDLIVRVRGGSRKDALLWAADFAGVAINDTPLSPRERERRAAERREIEHNLPTAKYWRRAAISLTEDLLAILKAALFDRALPQPEIGEIGRLEALLGSLRRADGTALVEEYRWWVTHSPGMTAAMNRVAKAREGAERRAILAYLRLTAPERQAE